MSRAFAVDVNVDTLSNVAALRALSVPSVTNAWTHVSGYYAAGDGGGGEFWWDSSSTASEDGGLVFRPASVSSGNPGRWRRFFSGGVCVDWFGAFGTGSTHPVSSVFGSGGGSLAAAQLIYPHVVSLSQEMDWVALQAAVNVAKAGASSGATIGLVQLSGKNYWIDSNVDCDRSLGISIRGTSSGPTSGTLRNGGTTFTWTSAAKYVNPTNTGSMISYRSSYCFSATGFNVQYVNPDTSQPGGAGYGILGHIFDGSHAGGESAATTTATLLPLMGFTASGISRASPGFVSIDGWKVGDTVHVTGSVSNDAHTGVISSIPDDSHLVFSGTPWTNETITFGPLGGLSSNTGDTQFATLRNLQLVTGASPGAYAGYGPKAWVSLSNAILCTIENCFFGTAQLGILFKDFGYGDVAYSNSHVVRNCTFGYCVAMSSAGESVLVDGCGVEGLGGETSAYVYNCPRTLAKVDCKFTFTSGPKTVTRSDGNNWSVDGWVTGMHPIAVTAAGDYYDLGIVTVVAGTMTCAGSVPDLVNVVDYEIYDDDAASGAGVRSTSQHGCTLTYSGAVLTRSGSVPGSFIDEGWRIGFRVNSYGGGGIGTVIGLTDTTMTFDVSPGDASHDGTDGYYITAGLGDGPVTFLGCWMGDQFRNDSWFHTAGGPFNLIGCYVNANARVLSNWHNPLSGSITGNNCVVRRQREVYLFEGLNGVNGMTIFGSQFANVRDRTFNGSNNLFMAGNTPIVDGQANQTTDDTYEYQKLRYNKGLRLSTTIAGTLSAATSLLQVDGAIATAYLKRVFADGDLALDRQHSFVDLDATGGNLTATLPDASLCPGREYTIKRFDNSGNTAQIATTSSQKIDQASSPVALASRDSSYTVVSSGAAWRVKAKIA